MKYLLAVLVAGALIFLAWAIHPGLGILAGMFAVGALDQGWFKD